MDGTIVDTEPYWIAAEHALVAEYQGTWTAEDAHSIVGFDLLDAAVQLRDRGGVDLDPHAIVERLLDRVVASCRDALPWRPGAQALLVEARDAGIPCVLVTMSWRRLADAVIDAAPAGAFVGSVTGDEVSAGKPSPEPYLRAAEMLGLTPAACLAIEDSPTGIESAVSAGCPTVAVPNVVAVPDRDDITVVPTLEGHSLADLHTLATS